MEQWYDVWWQGFEHRIIIDKSKIDFNRLGKDQNYHLNDLTGCWGTENLSFHLLMTIIYEREFPGLKYEKVSIV